eukprot:gb/GEZN01019897.1/.p1 GENE.gb/GEZN01019897.1/~~gb/GEZN01019897.1/.p1  ORF type:complete len:101 (+),score=20.78 gb/GEZN01019897.1/:1-303(+)
MLASDRHSVRLGCAEAELIAPLRKAPARNSSVRVRVKEMSPLEKLSKVLSMSLPNSLPHPTHGLYLLSKAPLSSASAPLLYEYSGDIKTQALTLKDLVEE